MHHMNVHASGHTVQPPGDGRYERGPAGQDFQAVSLTGNCEEGARELMCKTVAAVCFSRAR
jgi:hypothetical protein